MMSSTLNQFFREQVRVQESLLFEFGKRDRVQRVRSPAKNYNIFYGSGRTRSCGINCGAESVMTAALLSVKFCHF